MGILCPTVTDVNAVHLELRFLLRASLQDYMNINVSKVISEQIHVMCLLRRKSEKKLVTLHTK